jgi:hypothetical protein
MCVENECRALTFPEAVSLKRFLEPEWVFIFGIASRTVKQTLGCRPGAAAF